MQSERQRQLFAVRVVAQKEHFESHPEVHNLVLDLESPFSSLCLSVMNACESPVGIVLVHVPFRGAAEGVAAVIGGHVDFMFASAGVIEPYVRAGKLKALAQTTGERLPQLRAVPTLRELGFASNTVRDWQGIVAPAGTPTAILQQLSDALGKALEDREVRERFHALDVQVVTDSNPEAFSELMRSELAHWAAVAQSAHLHAD